MAWRPVRLAAAIIELGIEREGLMEHLTDAPVANILILAGIVFAAVGLFGKVGGFIGSIFGSIEAGKNSRILSGALGVVLIVGGGWMHEQADNQAAAPNPPTQTTQLPPNQSASQATPAELATSQPAGQAATAGTLQGAWLNPVENGRDGLHRLDIRQAGNLLQVRGWGRCGPKYCDWGIQEASLSGGAATVTWSLDQGQRQAAVTIGPVESGQLKVATHNTFTSGQTTQFSSSFVRSQ